VLAAARGHRRAADAAEAALLADVLAWCELHVTEDPDHAATWGDSPVRLGGVGCPWVREFTITELAAALGMSPAAGRALVADVLELAFRLPRLWAKVQAGQHGRVSAWRARRIADKTQSLSPEAASFVDGQVAEFANRIGTTQLDRLVEEAIGRFMPDLAAAQRDAAADQRHLTIHHDQVSYTGTSLIEGELDLADALDLDAALSHLAGELKDLGNDLPLDQRRALAAGELARRQFTLEYDWDTRAPEQISAAPVEDQPTKPRPSPRPARDLTLYAHLSAEGGVRLEGHGDRLLTPQTLREWLTIAGDVRVTIRPVLDLNARLVGPGRFATDLQHEQLTLRDRTCTAPHCNRPARRLDADHIQPWVDPDTGGPPGQTQPQTTSDNLAKLCRHHHRAKTFTTWTYTPLYPGLFLWTSPHGLRFLTFNGQTIDLD